MRPRTRHSLTAMKYAAPALLLMLLVSIFVGMPPWLAVPYAFAALAFFGAPLFGILLPMALRAAVSSARWAGWQGSRLGRALLGRDAKPYR